VLEDVGVTEAAGEGTVFAGALDAGERGDDGDAGADALDFDVGDVEFSEAELAGAHAVELLGLGDDFAGGGDAEEVVGEEFVHGRNVAGELGLTPLLLKGVHFELHLVLVVGLGGMLSEERRGDEESANEQG